MGLDEDRLRLIEAARALVARGQVKFTIAAVCAQAGVARPAFHGLFGGKAALLQALEAPQPPDDPQDATQDETPADSKAALSEPGISTPDAWLERRLRVFERALTALEAKAELTARAHALAIARLEEKLMAGVQPHPAPAMPLTAEIPQPQALVVEEAPPPKPDAPDLLPPETAPMVIVSKEEMTEVLQAARSKVSVASDRPQMEWALPVRWLAIGALSVVALLACVRFTLGETASRAGEGVTIRRLASGPHRLMAQADAGDAHAQARLAMSYLRGGDSEGAERWSDAAAQSGLPVAQYLAAALMDDKQQALALLRAAAGQGNLKAMHNLAIAYAQGQGTEKNQAEAADWFARAAAHGYVDSAFDLAVLYERGEGVKQDLRQALKWYSIAALAGDAASKERADFLRSQLVPSEVKLAEGAARGFSPLPAISAANTL